MCIKYVESPIVKNAAKVGLVEMNVSEGRVFVCVVDDCEWVSLSQ